VISAPPESDDLFREPSVFFWIHNVNSSTEHGDCLSLSGDGAAMRQGIDAPSQSADGYKASSDRSIESRSAIPLP
jgi:hypothetical protein